MKPNDSEAAAGIQHLYKVRRHGNTPLEGLTYQISVIGWGSSVVMSGFIAQRDDEDLYLVRLVEDGVILAWLKTDFYAARNLRLLWMSRSGLEPQTTTELLLVFNRLLRKEQ